MMMMMMMILMILMNWWADDELMNELGGVVYFFFFFFFSPAFWAEEFGSVGSERFERRAYSLLVIWGMKFRYGVRFSFLCE